MMAISRFNYFVTEQLPGLALALIVGLALAVAYRYVLVPKLSERGIIAAKVTVVSIAALCVIGSVIVFFETSWL